MKRNVAKIGKVIDQVRSAVRGLPFPKSDIRNASAQQATLVQLSAIQGLLGTVGASI